jgi:hypothetical protein
MHLNDKRNSVYHFEWPLALSDLFIFHGRLELKKKKT